MTSAQPADLDQASLAEILDLGGEELLGDLAADFRSFSEQAAADIDQAAAAGDCAAVKESAHSIKSTSSSLGALDLHRRLVELEAAAMAGDLDQVRRQLPEVHTALGAANAALAARTQTPEGTEPS